MGGIITLGDRVRTLRKEKLMSQHDLARRANVTQGVISGLESGRNNSSVALVDIARALGTTVEYLTTGVDERQKTDNIIFNSKHTLKPIPIISFVQAGNWREAVEHGVIGYIFSTSIGLSANSFGVIVMGKSMSPDFNEGDSLTIDTEVCPHPGDAVVAINGKGEATLKKYRPRGLNTAGEEVFELVPINPDFATLYSDRENIKIIGTVVEHTRKLR